MTHRVAVLAVPTVDPFRLSVPSAVLGAHAHYAVRVCTPRPGRVLTSAGFDLTVDDGLEVLGGADTVVLPGWDPDLDLGDELLDGLRSAHARGARMLGLCLGAFTLAAAGLLDDREATTHWSFADELARRHPRVRVRPDVLWSDLGDVVTSAGNAAALDCCLHVLREDLGAAAARDVARTLVLAPHREGSQAQFVPSVAAEVEGHDVVGPALAWALERLADPLGLDAWSAAAGLSRRTFTRRFAEQTGQSPHQWLLGQRLARAKDLLESGDATVDRIARDVGFASSASLRHHFQRRFGSTPSAHREAFAGR